jgi:DNA-binding Xre family transcriptional regulator
MSELQKNIINKLLKEQKKSKRDLAKFLKIKENSINRTLKNPNITFLKLEKIAEFLEINVRELLPDAIALHEGQGEYALDPIETINNQTVMNFSEVLKRTTRTIEIMAETERANVKNIESLVKIIAGKHTDSNN